MTVGSEVAIDLKGQATTWTVVDAEYVGAGERPLPEKIIDD